MDVRVLRGIVGGALVASGAAASAAAPPQPQAPPIHAPLMKRAAILLPPVKLEPGEVPAVARGASDDPALLGSTPVVRESRGASIGSGPAWLSGVDPNVIPAGGVAPRAANEAPPANSTPTSLPTAIKKLFERTRKPESPSSSPNPDQPNSNTPFRGISASGAPLIAGPPAYRWYGYGTTTPGANRYAPNGQYPRGSANWYTVSGATPGAFAVPVVNPYRSAPGNQPPSYLSNPAIRPMPEPMAPAPAATSQDATFAPARPAQIVVQPATERLPEPNLSISSPMSSPPAEVRPTFVQPTSGELGSTPVNSTLPPLPTPIGVPRLGAPPALPSAPTGSPGFPLAPVKPPEGVAPPSGTAPVLPPPNLGLGTLAPPIQARGQAPQPSRPDPASQLIQAICRGKANGVDVRWTGSRKVMVCFEVRTEPEAKRLVREISARPELAPLAIDFCVVVK